MALADCISGYNEVTLLLLLLKAQAGSPTGTHEQVDGTVASASSVNTYTAGTVVRLVAINASAHFRFAATPAVITDAYLPPDVPEYFIMDVDSVITVIGALVDITEME